MEKAEGQALDVSNERDIQNFVEKIGDFDYLVFTGGDTLKRTSSLPSRMSLIPAVLLA